jgi:acyl-CoA synthetase (NDP forming)
MADNILGDDYRLNLTPFAGETAHRLGAILEEARLAALVDVKNPMDINPMANDTAYESVMKEVLNDPCIDMLVLCLVPLTGALKTLEPAIRDEDSIALRVPRLVKESGKPVVAVVDSGKLFDPLEDALQSAGVVTFRSADRAVWTLGRYARARLYGERLRQDTC